MAEAEMLETRFEITSPITADATRAILWTTAKRNKSAWIRMGIICAIAIGFAIYFLYRGMASVAALYLCVSFIMPIRTVFSLKRESRKLYETMMRLAPEKKTYCTFSDRSFSCNGGRAFSYSQLSAITEDARYFFLFFGGSSFFLDKSGFTKGNPQDFLPFIQERMTKAVAPLDGPM